MKSIRRFFKDHAPPTRLVDKLPEKTITPGALELPVDKRQDENAQLRIDAGERIGGKQSLVLQVNSQAESPALKKWLNSNGHGTHGKLATVAFDTEAADLQAEGERVAQEMKEQASEKLG